MIDFIIKHTDADSFYRLMGVTPGADYCHGKC